MPPTSIRTFLGGSESASFSNVGFLFLVSCFLFLVSCFLFSVFWIMPENEKRETRNGSVSCFLFLVSCLWRETENGKRETDSVSCFLFFAMHLCPNLSRENIQDRVWPSFAIRFYSRHSFHTDASQVRRPWKIIIEKHKTRTTTRAIKHGQQESENEKRKTRNEKRETGNEKRETRNGKRETRNDKREPRNVQRETENDKRETGNVKR